MAIDEFKKFSELFHVLMLGTGAGLSVERKYIEKLPKINTKTRVISKALQPVAPSKRLEFTELHQIADDILEIRVGDSKFGRLTCPL